MNTAEDPQSHEAEDRIREAEKRFVLTSRKLEHRIRTLRRGVWLLAALLVTVVAAGATVWLNPSLLTQREGRGEVVSASQFVLKDSNGRDRGSWSVLEDGTARLTLFDQEGQDRMNLTVLPSGFPGMSFANQDGERRMVLGILPDETSNLVFADGEGVPRAVLGLSRGQSANLLLADQDGVSRIGLALDGSGNGSMLLPDSLAEEGEAPKIE